MNESRRHPAPGLRLCFSSILAIVVFALSTTASTQAQNVGDSLALDARADSIRAVDASEIATRLEGTAVVLRRLERLARPDADVDALATQWHRDELYLQNLKKDTEAGLQRGMSTIRLDELIRQWQAVRSELDAREALLTGRAKALETGVAEARVVRTEWETVRSERAGALPTSLVARLDTAYATANRLEQHLRDGLSDVLAVQAAVTTERIAAADVEERLAIAREEALQRLLVRDRPPIWREFSRPATEADSFAVSLSDSALASIRLARRSRVLTLLISAFGYVGDYTDRLALHVILFGLVLLVFLRLRHRLNLLAEQDGSLSPYARMLERPVSAALLVALLLTPVVYPFPPDSVLAVGTLLSIAPTVRLLQRQWPSQLHLTLYGVVGLIGLFVGIGLIPEASFGHRLALLGLDVVALGAIGWFLRPGGATDLLETLPIGKFGIAVVRVSGVLLIAALVANCLGYANLALQLTRGVVSSGFFSLFFYVGAIVVDGIVIAAVLGRLFAWVRFLRSRTDTVVRAITRAVHVMAVLGWSYMALDSVGLLDALYGVVRGTLGASWQIGETDLSLGDVVTFILTLWGSVLIARFVRMVLEEDVLERMPLARGIPNAVSRVGFYALVAFGFFLALTAAGVPLDRLAILTGALGVGIGFGLQDVVNNFISGIILMFERPIQPGDKIEFGTRSGIVKQIGIRSSVVRTYEGADVNVPNSHLISNEVTNWTKDDELRRIDVNVSIAYSADPRRVAEIMRRVSTGHARIRQDLAPDVTLVKFRDLGFEMSLRCWPVDPREWWGLRTEMAFLVHEALRAEGIEFPLARLDADHINVARIGATSVPPGLQGGE